VGNPDKFIESGNSKFATIDIAPHGSYGIIEYTNQIEGGKVTEVTYLNSGNFFGVIQRDSARAIHGR
jgi:hypothetical protein